MNQIVIDEEFKNLISPLGDDEYNQLKENILRDECRDPLVVWLEKNILLDGHHRYAICTDEDKPYKVAKLSFDDRLAAREWVLKNQLGRRNLSPDMIAYLRGRLYDTRKEREGRPNKRSQNETVISGRTSEKIAAETGVHRQTIMRDAAFATAVDEIAKNTDQEVKQAILNGTMRMTREETVNLAKQGADKQQLFVNQRRKRIQERQAFHEDISTPEEIERESKISREMRDNPALKALNQDEAAARVLHRSFCDYMKFKEMTQLEFSGWSAEQAQYLHGELSEYIDLLVDIRQGIERSHPQLKTRGLRRVK